MLGQVYKTQGVIYDAMGGGWGPTTGSSSFSYSHTAAAGAYVVVDIAVDRTASVTSITYGGTAMTSLGSVTCPGYSGSGAIFRYGIVDSSGGTKTIAGALSSSSLWGASGSVSYLNVKSVGTAQTTSGSSGPTQTVTCTSGQMIVDSIMIPQAPIGTISGGTNRWTGSNSYLSIEISDAGSSATFSTSSTGHYWAALATVLSNH